ncbi:FAD:protein FMN transferase [Ferrimonas aestuarii]|uniref:FAD:protein FMN transferase n=1 Tax=Ferrimonas aestuarii TaxID=2569539 RepID=A0A4U1BFD0_9GAMM|nr:FAD:protein FMN transferase [Ferrimonas aestuarii]TKB49614.1 FAD:protein FMN transferase [Ferrimonas aestuarii]
MQFQARTTLWLALVGLAMLLSGCGEPQKIQSVEGHTMGTTYHVSWVDTDTPLDPLLVQGEIDLRLGQVNRSMSTWKRSSEISIFNRLHTTEPYEISSEFATVVQEAKRLSLMTDGALDVTVGPLVNLWGFGKDGQIDTAPDDAIVQKILQVVGDEKLTLQGQWLSKTVPELQIGLGAIAKGYGVDVVATVLESKGIHDYIVEVGGELRVKGQKPEGKPWRIAIERPDPSGRDIFSVIEPGENAVATSGDYRNFFERDGKHFSHLIDPKTGYPVTHHLVSTTVITSSCMTADGLATAMMVMGVEKSLELADRQKLAVMLIERVDGEFKVHYSDAFRRYLDKE